MGQSSRILETARYLIEEQQTRHVSQGGTLDPPLTAAHAGIAFEIDDDEVVTRERQLVQAVIAVAADAAAEQSAGLNAAESVDQPRTERQKSFGQACETRAKATGGEARTITAGYQWFTDWGRDTMIVLEGLTLTTVRHAEAGLHPPHVHRPRPQRADSEQLPGRRGPRGLPQGWPAVRDSPHTRGPAVPLARLPERSRRVRTAFLRAWIISSELISEICRGGASRFEKKSR